MREIAGKLEISERGGSTGRRDKYWVRFEREIGAAVSEPHLAACGAELDVDTAAVPQHVPDVLVINGFTCRTEI